MQTIAFLFTGLITGSILVHFIFKLTVQKHCVTEAGLDGAAQLTAVLQLGNSQPAIKKMLSNGASATISLSFFGKTWANRQV